MKRVAEAGGHSSHGVCVGHIAGVCCFIVTSYNTQMIFMRGSNPKHPLFLSGSCMIEATPTSAGPSQHNISRQRKHLFAGFFLLDWRTKKPPNWIETYRGDILSSWGGLAGLHHLCHRHHHLFLRFFHFL